MSEDALHPTPSVKQLAAETGSLLRQNFEIFLLMLGLSTVVSLMLLAPLRSWFQEVQQLADQTESLDLEILKSLELPTALPWSIAGLLAFSIFLVIMWVRIIGIDRSAAFEGGLTMLSRRFAIVLWRHLCFLALLLVAIVVALIAVILLSLVLMVIIAALGLGEQARDALNGVASGLLIYAAILPLVIGLTISVTTTAMDQGIGILDSLKLWMRNWLPLTLCYVGLASLEYLAGFPVSKVAEMSPLFGLGLGMLFSSLSMLLSYALVIIWLDHQK